MRLKVTEFRCPQCKGELIGGTSLLCNSCPVAYAVNDEIIDFRCHRMDYYFNPVVKDDMDALIQAMETDSWQETVRKFLKKVNHNTDWLDNLVIDGRYAWKTLLNLTSDTVLLDLGCGLGNLSKNIAPHISKVYAMDLTLSRLEFAKKRFAKFNPEDKIVLLAGGDGTYLPFPDDALDCVVLSGVLEWVGAEDTYWSKENSKLRRAIKMVFSYFGKYHPRTIQLNFLREIKRILKPEGQIFIAIENRLNYEYFTGRPDHHSNLKYASLLPRFLANLYSIVTRRNPYRTYTYSIPGYKKLLRKAGFEQTDFFALSPGYSKLKELFPVEAETPKWCPSAPSDMKNRIKRNKYFVPAYGIVSSASRVVQPCLQDRLLKHIEQSLAEQFKHASITLNDYIVTAKDKGVITGFIGEQGIVIKLPFNSAGVVGEKKNAAMLQYAKNRNLFCCPRSLIYGSFQNQHYFVEERVKGCPLYELLPSQGRTVYLNSIASILDQLNPSIRDMLKLPLIDTFYHSQVSQQLEVLFQVIEDYGTREALTHYFHNNLYGVEVPCGIRHGDFTRSNIFVHNNRVITLIDWEMSSTDGIPLFDAFHYLVSVHQLFYPEELLPQGVSLLDMDRYVITEEKDFLIQQYARYGMDTSNHVALVYLFWLHCVTYQLKFSLIYDVPWIRKCITRVVNLLLKTKN